MGLTQIRKISVGCGAGGKGQWVSSVHDVGCLPCPSSVVGKGKGFRLPLACSFILTSSLMSQENVSNFLNPSESQFPHLKNRDDHVKYFMGVLERIK